MVFSKFFDINIDGKDEVFSQIKEEFKSGDIGYYSLPFKQKDQVQEIIEVTKTKDLDYVVVVGIGGSSLGAKAIDRLLRHKKTNNTKLLFLENSDPIAITEILKEVNLERANFVITSKSGSTIETTSIFKYVLSLYGKTPSEAKDHFFVITDKDSGLDKFAEKNSIQSFHMYPNVGGRFSVLSAVGLLPLALAGYDIEELLLGARELSESFFAESDKHNLIGKAFYYAQGSKEKNINVIFAYGNEFEELTKWYVQLWGESLGKLNSEEKNVGLTPIGIVGSVDQHSFLQLIMEGPKDKTVTFIKLKDFQCNIEVPDITLDFLEKTDYINKVTFQDLINAQCDATLEAVESKGVDVDLIEIEQLNERSVGYIIYYYELLTSLTGAFLKVNTYNQPGVELGKQILETKFK